MIFEVVLFLTLLLVYYILKDRKPAGMPPGPWEIPFIGNKPLDSVEILEKHRKQYGDIYTTRMGNERIVVISNYQLAKDMLAHADLSDRPLLFDAFRMHPGEKGGLVSSNGRYWVHDRRFVLRQLRDLGMGKTYLEQAIQEEAKMMVDDIKKTNTSEPSLFPRCLRVVILNVIWQLVASKRYAVDSKEVEAIFQVFEDLRDTSMFMFVEHVFPIAKLIPSPIKNYFFKTDLTEKFRIETLNIIQSTIDEHREKLDINDPRDLIDEYLVEMEKNKDNPDNLFTLESLHQIVSDLFGAGSDTTSSMLRWMIFFMVKYPEKVKRCQEQIDQEIHKEEMISILDKEKLPYVEAYITEALRYATMAFIGGERELSNDFKVGDYIIPKGTGVTPNAYFIHHDQSYWKDPEQFRPERFLNKEGKYDSNLVRTLAFGSGRRVCLGESLARMELFIFGSAILKNFTVQLPEGAKLDETVKNGIGLRLPVDQPFVYKYRY